MKPKYSQGQSIDEFTIHSIVILPKPIEIFSDGRINKVFGWYRVFSKLTRSFFDSAIISHRLAGRWTAEIALDSKNTIELAKVAKGQ